MKITTDTGIEFDAPFVAFPSLAGNGDWHWSQTDSGGGPPFGVSTLVITIDGAPTEALSFTYSSAVSGYSVNCFGIWNFANSITGNLNGTAQFADKLSTARTINGVSFDGSANITIPAGDVNGPASAVDGRVALFDGTTGKLLKVGGQLSTVATVAAPVSSGLYGWQAGSDGWSLAQPYSTNLASASGISASGYVTRDLFGSWGVNAAIPWIDVSGTADVAMKSAVNTWSGKQTFSGGIGLGGTTSQVVLGDGSVGAVPGGGGTTITTASGDLLGDAQQLEVVIGGTTYVISANEKAPAGAAKWWRLKITANNGDANYTSLAELEFKAGGVDKTSGGTAFASSEFNSSYSAAQAFDNSYATNPWATLGGAAFPHYIGYHLTSYNAITVVTMTARNSSYVQMPKDFELQKSTDSTTGLDGTWTTVKSWTGQTGWTSNQTRTFTV